MDGKTLQELKRVNIKEVNPDELVDISEIEIDTKQSVQKRVKEYVEQVHNPYLVRVGEYVVKIGYSDCEETLNDRMKQYISKLQKQNTKNFNRLFTVAGCYGNLDAGQNSEILKITIRSNLVGQVQLTEIKNSKNQEEAECRKK